MAHRVLPAVAVTAAFLAAGCSGSAVIQPSAAGRLDDGGVTVQAVLRDEPDGSGDVRVTFSPDKPGYHLYSIHLPPGGVGGLGIPTALTVRGLRMTGSATAD